MKFDAKSFLKSLTTKPGVYLMINKQGKILYVGKARNLKKRVSSYFRKNQKDSKTSILMQQVASVKTIITPTENAALVLENNLIKEHHPRYNILLRDDKSYPYLHLSDDDFPRLEIYRGKQHKGGQYFGPYPSVVALKETLNLLQKLFKIRRCKNVFFKLRKRPCLQYQIKKCSAPCVNLISKDEYKQDILHAVMFLEGKSDKVIHNLMSEMESVSQQQKYEAAAKHRDRIQYLREIQNQQQMHFSKQKIDVFAIVKNVNIVCVYVLLIRNGQIFGNKVFFLKLSLDDLAANVLETFVSQYYLNESNKIPEEILLSCKLEHKKTLQEVLSQDAKKKIQLKNNVRGEKAGWLKTAVVNAEQNLKTHLLNQTNLYQQFSSLQKALSLAKLPMRIECFDISHTMGEATVASCVVFNLEGAEKNDYRRFNIKDITKGDDYAAMKQALMRHYTRLQRAEDLLPNLLIIDGGKGQLKIAENVLTELQIKDVVLLGVAKGVTRKPGDEELYLTSKSMPLILPSDDPALHLIQQIRDEAHRFAITGHRKQRGKARQKSVLEDIAGVGVKRRQELLKHFGGLQGILKASIDDLAKVPGVSKQLAQKIYDAIAR